MPKMLLRQRLVAIAALIVLAATLSGCTKCGWIWNEGARPASCRGDAPLQ